MSAQRARSAVTADHRSAHPDFPGVPWWAAVLIAATATAIGFAFDAGAGNKELSAVFAGLYALGCVCAVLAVRQSGVFTAVIQPPLILFASVPTSYYLFHNGQVDGLRDLAINCGYPLIERFPLMFFTSAGVLLIGMARWYYGMTAGRAAPRSTGDATSEAGLASAVTSKVSSLLRREPDDDEVEPAEPPRRRRTTERPTRAAAGTTRSGKPAKRTTPSRSRHSRPPDTEIIEPVAERPRRTRTPRQSDSPVPPVEPRRRTRTSSSTPRKSVPPPERGYERPQRRRRVDEYEPLEPHGTNGNGTHHPISRVRYRPAEDGDDHVQQRSRPRSPRRAEAESWEYDV